MRPARVVQVALVLLAIAAAVLSPSSVQADDAEVEHGWWWRAQALPLAIPTPPVVPERGMWISAQSVSAARFATPADGNAVLVIDVDRLVGEAADIVACPAASGWQPAEAGAWKDRPSADCESAAVAAEAVPGDAEPGAAPTALRFDLTSVAANGEVDIVLRLSDGASQTTSAILREPRVEIADATPSTTSPVRRQPAAPGSLPTPPDEREPLVFDPLPVVVPEAEVEILRPADVSLPSLPKRAGERTPLAILPAAAVAAVWLLRARAAAMVADRHPLVAQPVALPMAGRV